MFFPSELPRSQESRNRAILGRFSFHADTGGTIAPAREAARRTPMRTTDFWGRGPSRTRSRRRDHTSDPERWAARGMRSASGTARADTKGKKARPTKIAWKRNDAWGTRDARNDRSEAARAAEWTRPAKNARGSANTIAGPKAPVAAA